MGKRRSQKQVIKDLSEAKLSASLSEWIVNKLSNDFGFDFEVRLTDEASDGNQDVSEIFFLIQLKSTHNEDKGQGIEDLSIVDWELFQKQSVPVLLIKYYKSTDTLYYEIIQPYVWDVLEKEDPNWKRGGTKRIRLSKRVDDLNSLKDEIIESQKRITKHQSLGFGIGEGLRITSDDLSELQKAREKGLLEFKGLSLIESYEVDKNGDPDKAIELLMEVYNSPQDDEAKIRAIIGLFYHLNIAIPEENRQLLRLAWEGMEISKKISKLELLHFIAIHKNHAEAFIIFQKISQTALSLLVQKQGEDRNFPIFFSEHLKDLRNKLQEIIIEINFALEHIMKEHQYEYYFYSLPIIIDILTLQIMHIGTFESSLMESSINEGNKIISQCEFVIDQFDDPDLNVELCKHVSNYYYWSKNKNKAMEYIEKAIELSEANIGEHYTNYLKGILKQINERSDPYDPGEKPDFENMSISEYQEYFRKQIELQGIDVSLDDDIGPPIRMALDDLNPEEYMKYCKNLFVKYMPTSMLGRSIGLPAMSMKWMWCKHRGALGGMPLKGLFRDFKNMYCDSCPHLEPREDDWVCTQGFIEKQEEDPDFKIFLEGLSK